MQRSQTIAQLQASIRKLTSDNAYMRTRILLLETKTDRMINLLNAHVPRWNGRLYHGETAAESL